MSDTVTQAHVKDHPVLWYSNGVWRWMPHRGFFQAMLGQHLGKLRGDHNIQARRTTEEAKILFHLELGEVVNVNGFSFRYKGDTA